MSWNPSSIFDTTMDRLQEVKEKFDKKDEAENDEGEQDTEEKEESGWSKNFGGISWLFDISPGEWFQRDEGESKKDLVLALFDKLGDNLKELKNRTEAIRNVLFNVQKKQDKHSSELNDLNFQVNLIKRGWEFKGVCKTCHEAARREKIGMIWEKDGQQKCHRPKCSGSEVDDLKKIEP